ncbi:hypothetical protein C8R43DRAFT_958976 [Mycena crocata]|nr:hypothetical protein C8R43DRAFT_958976 [Mycena crocata]
MYGITLVWRVRHRCCLVLSVIWHVQLLWCCMLSWELRATGIGAWSALGTRSVCGRRCVVKWHLTDKDLAVRISRPPPPPESLLDKSQGPLRIASVPRVPQAGGGNLVHAASRANR